jgi:putative membrane protein
LDTIGLPTLNAVLNTLSGISLLVGFLYIRRGNRSGHMRAMLSAFALSALFLVSYVYYHYTVGSTSFTAGGWIRPVYFTILISHTVLATVIMPPILVLLYRAWRGEYRKHARLARWVFPAWLYVSVTGLIIYLMLYHWYPPVV